MRPPRKFRTLFLCTGNSARSILGEALLNHLAGERMSSASAGTNPTGKVHPMALRVLQELYGIDAGGAWSKSIRDLGDEEFDLVITVCDGARETCPIFPAKTATVHWGLPDPAAVNDPEDQHRAFLSAARAIHRSLKAMLSLPVESMEPAALKRRLQELAPSLSIEENR